MYSVCSQQGIKPLMDSGYYYVLPDIILLYLYFLHIFLSHDAQNKSLLPQDLNSL